MLKPENRLKKTRDFNLLIKQGRWTSGSLLDVKVLKLDVIKDALLPKKISKADFRNQLKIAFTVGLKIEKRAVYRNRIKRQLREVVRLLIKENRLKKGYYLLFVAKKEIKEVEYGEIARDVTEVLRLSRVLI
jgi:ribonuclease P protein component